MNIDTSYIERCLKTMDNARRALLLTKQNSEFYDIYRAAIIKEFELILEQAGKLLRRALRDYVSNPSDIDRAVFKDVFRMAAQHGIITEASSKNWLRFRDSRNATAHNYGEQLADEILELLADFSVETQALVQNINRLNQP
jgi:nucleotidyltransferase substrate binding protein (TIGR01987 family)